MERETRIQNLQMNACFQQNVLKIVTFLENMCRVYKADLFAGAL